ncbi:MAG: tRNA (N(6)-L-threonylcarbamoyladenosine(37)-C(2))-methylthiotransferase MtaB [Candidatus Eisenbacteria bacterium]|nr:tRNA (N(6)-L-threonylcarbamoyladenosine(37)-C(2))-methylthiotransferase MtaB [Candidatus Eisenbacteria bacterium]
MTRDDRPAPESRALADLAHRPGPAVGPTVALHSFGCKLNQCETAGIRSRFVEAGFTAVSVWSRDAGVADQRHVAGGADPGSRLTPADVHVINTCSVTGRADAQARQFIRKLIRQQPAARVVVTGCYAQRAPEEIARIPGVFLVAGNGEKDQLHELVGEMMGTGGLSAPGTPGAPFSAETLAARINVSDLRKVHRSFDLSPIDFGERTRAFLRVQDGCDAGCTFCIIPRIRGRSTSMGTDQAVAQARAVIEAGYREIVLTGIHLGMYGRDHAGPSLARLIDAIQNIPGTYRLRLSSIEPQEIDDDLIDRIADGHLVPHLHVPLQSGSDRILTLMNRTYRADQYDAVLQRLNTRVDPMGIGADVIVGFPGETDADFEATVRFIEDRPFTYLHVFPFSPRPGTRAATLPGRPPGPVVDDRSSRLRMLSDRKRREFAERFVNRTVQVLVEEPGSNDFWDGWSEHYVRVRLDTRMTGDLTRRMVRVRCVGLTLDGVYGGVDGGTVD